MALMTEHLEDFKRSALNEASIALMGIEAKRPQDIKLRGVTSAVRIPYWNLNGSTNCFERLKLFPAITTADGHTQKYYQAPDSPPHLYLAPFFSWSTVAKKAECPIQFTEGEKKAAAFCQRGKFCVGVAGVWNWRQKLETGERLVIPTLDQFVWDGRPVELIPDSDVWRPDKQQALSGFYALGQEMISRGATVRLVQLPEQGRAKVGLDDWLVAVGADWEHQWPHLERLPLDDARLAPVAAWWQKWREKQATVDALQTQPEDTLTLQEFGGLYTVTCPTYSLTFLFERCAEARGGVHAELTVRIGAREILVPSDISLKSDSSRSKLINTLKSAQPTIAWKPLLERACSLVLHRHREGEPVIVLEPSASAHVPFIVNPLIYREHQTLVYAPGGSCKSYLALWLALLACHGGYQAGVSALRTSVLYLDWELNAETVGGRLKAIQTAHPELAQIRPYYRRCESPLHLEAHQIAKHVAERHIAVVIVDSAAMACGGDLASPDSAIRLQRALRMIGCASLVLAHVSKNTPDGQDKTAFGTVFFRELARNVWELHRADGAHPVRLALTQTKNNFGPSHPTLGFELTFSQESLRIDACDPQDEPVFAEKLPVPARIRNLLEDHTPRTAKEIAEELNVKLVTVRSALSREKGRKWQQVGDDYRNPQWTVLGAK